MRQLTDDIRAMIINSDIETLRIFAASPSLEGTEVLAFINEQISSKLAAGEPERIEVKKEFTGISKSTAARVRSNERAGRRLR